MKIALVSDSHGNKKGIDELFLRGGFDYLFFLGDGLGDLGSYAYLDNVFVVSGNCDFFSSEPNEKVVELGKTKFFVTHGNKYGVKYSLESLVSRAKEVGAKVVCFGHTHKVFMEEIDGILFLNPGSFKRCDGVSSGTILEIDGDKYSVSTIRV